MCFVHFSRLKHNFIYYNIFIHSSQYISSFFLHYFFVLYTILHTKILTFLCKKYIIEFEVTYKEKLYDFHEISRRQSQGSDLQL